ncbi:hypothetical protein AZ013_000631 [Citrobacter freundii]|nr:hypothetical protein AZ013_000631 [Citrobacter freundii]
MQTISSHPTRATQPCLSPVEIWQRLLTYLLLQHYGLTLNDTPFSNDSTIQEHIDAGISLGLAPIFPYTFYRLTHYWFVAADIPVANGIPVHCADAIRCNVRRPPQDSLPLLTRQVSA